MAKLTKKRCKMCGTKIDPEKVVVHEDDNYCSQSCVDWHIETFEQDDEAKNE